MSSFDEYLQSVEHAREYEREVAFFERNRVEISIGLVLACLFFFTHLKLFFWIGVAVLVAFAVLRRIPALKPRLFYIWRVWFMPLAQLDDWIMMRWRDVKVWGAGVRKRLAHDWQLFAAWAAVALQRDKDEIAVAAMGQYKFGLIGRPFAPERLLVILAFVAGLVLGGGVQSWRIGRLKSEHASYRVQVKERIEGWSAYAKQRDRDYAALAAQRNGELRQAASEQLKTAELLEAERARRTALARRERTRNDEAAKAAAGGPAPDWERGLRELADPSAGAPSAGGGSAPAATPAGDPPG